MYFREVIFGQGPYTPQGRNNTNWMLFLSIALISAVAWRYGLISSAVRISEGIAVVIYNVLCDLAASMSDFLKSIRQLTQLI